MAPGVDFSWLIEIESDLALMMRPRSKQDRLVLAEVLVEAGVTLMAEAEASSRPALSRAPAVSEWADARAFGNDSHSTKEFCSARDWAQLPLHQELLVDRADQS
jgi:hypothetical protein